jgi:IS1 family transposase
MNKISTEKRIQILSMLVEGSSMRSISRVVDVSINTVAKLLVDAGMACAAHHGENVREINAQRVQCDEIWSFCYTKQRNVTEEMSDGAGDVWTWTAIDVQSKLICGHLIGDRSADSARDLMAELTSRLASHMQLTTDGHKAYLQAVEGAFSGGIDYAKLVKLYGPFAGNQHERRYSAGECCETIKGTVCGKAKLEHDSTSYVERRNLTMRMSRRRFTRMTNAFSKKLENYMHALALYFTVYNFVRIHKTLKTTPAMQSGITDKLWSMADVAALVEVNEGHAKKRGPYKNRKI